MTCCRENIASRLSPRVTMFRAPRYASMPHLLSMVDNIGYSHEQLARHLGLSLRTVQAYIKAGQAPRPVMYALFWETSWGQGHVNADAANDARSYYSEALILRRKVQQLEHMLHLLETEREDHIHAANSPVFRSS